jgi:hypothetical protein
MATTSVSPESNNASDLRVCPGFLDILFEPTACEDETDPAQLERIRAAAEYTFNATIDGLRAIGNLLFHCKAYSTEPIDDQMLDIGWFIQEMSTLTRRTHEIESAATYQLRKLEIAKARGGRS